MKAFFGKRKAPLIKHYKRKLPTMVIMTRKRDPRAVRPYTGGQVWGSGRLPWGASPGRRKKQPEGWWVLAQWGGWGRGSRLREWPLPSPC